METVFKFILSLTILLLLVTCKKSESSPTSPDITAISYDGHIELSMAQMNTKKILVTFLKVFLEY